MAAPVSAGGATAGRPEGSAAHGDMSGSAPPSLRAHSVSHPSVALPTAGLPSPEWALETHLTSSRWGASEKGTAPACLSSRNSDWSRSAWAALPHPLS